MPTQNTQAKSQMEYFSSEGLVEKYTSDAIEGLSEKERKAITRYFPAGGSTVLDFGCGTGRTTTVLERMGYDVIGVDFTAAYIEQGRLLFLEPEFVVGGASSLPFDDDAFDAVLFSSMGLDVVLPEENRYRSLRAIRRVLRPGAPFIFSSHNLWGTYVIRSIGFEGIREFLGFWAENIRQNRLFSRQKSDTIVVDGPTDVYYIRPSDQRQQLRNCGFEVVDTIRATGLLRSRFHHPHYVAKKLE